jgi:hypothetical protein
MYIQQCLLCRAQLYPKELQDYPAHTYNHNIFCSFKLQVLEYVVDSH